MPDSASIIGARRTDLILHEIESLPTLPSVATRLMKVGSSDDADLQEIIKLIETDPPLTAKILSMCRRADLGLSSRITSVKRAVILLGLETVQSMVLGVQVLEWSKSVANRRRDPIMAPSDLGMPQTLAEQNAATFDQVGFWRHSIAVACCAEMIAARDRSFGVHAGEAFVAGLLHDLGKLALNVILPQAYLRVIELSEHRLANIADVEQSVIGLDHHSTGKRLAEKWELPSMLRDAIWLHGQRPDALPEGPHKKLIGVVHVADSVCRGLHLGWSGNHLVGAPLMEACRQAGLDAEKVQQTLPGLLAAVATRCADLHLSDEPSERMVLDALAGANQQLARLSESANRRIRSSQEQSRVLDEVASFVSEVRPERGVVETLAAIAASAAKMFGHGMYAAVISPQGGGPVTVLTFSEDAKHHRCDVVDIPDGVEPSAADASLLSLGGLRSIVPARAVLDIPGGAVLDLAPSRETDRPTRHGTRGGGAVLVLDKDHEIKRLGPKLAGLLISVWGSALSSAIREEAASRESEELAVINLRLAHAEKQLAEAESMVRLAELTAGAAHEFNNPLAIISGRGQLLELGAESAGQKHAAAAVVQAARNLSDLVQRLHTIARPPEPVLAPANISEVLAAAVERATERTKRKEGQKEPASIQVSISERLGLARVDRELVTQALVEVLVNAIESEPSDFVGVRVQTDPVDDRLLIQVTDTGRGMSKHALKHAMDPFFSEKPAGRQPGLGLALACRLLALQHGTISIDSTPGDGTTVTIAFDDWRWTKEAARIAA